MNALAIYFLGCIICGLMLYLSLKFQLSIFNIPKEQEMEIYSLLFPIFIIVCAASWIGALVFLILYILSRLNRLKI
jgi:hypothetical protein